jgi:uracil phosphoribosyltransferase
MRRRTLSRTATFTTVEYFLKTPSDLQDRLVIVVAPVIATANTAAAAIVRLKERRAKEIRYVSLLASSQGLERLRSLHPDVPIWTAGINEHLDDRGLIIPGLSDAGDRAYGTK